jgi:hypothetical protein
MEAVSYWLTKSLSDLNGTDPYIHSGMIQGVFRKMDNTLVRRERQPSVLQMWSTYREVKGKIPLISKRCGTQSVFQARAFEEISFATRIAAGGIIR